MVGHEITHVLEGTELYNELQSAITEYAKSKGDYQGRFDALTELYKDIEGADIDAELTADLVGDYLFTDADFVQRLSTEHRGVFQKLFDEIKHLCKLATAGTKEARELEKVKKLFEDTYRTETKNPTADGGVKYSLNIEHIDGTVEELTDLRDLTDEQAIRYLESAQAFELLDETYIPVRRELPQVIIDSLLQENINVANRSLVMQAGKARRLMRKDTNRANGKRGHGLTPRQIVDIINDIENPVKIFYQTNRVGQNGESLPDNVAIFVKYSKNGVNGFATVEFENPERTEAIGREFGETNFYTVNTAFFPDTTKNGKPFNYMKQLEDNPDNIELEIKRRQSEDSANWKKHPSTTNELPFNNSIRNPDEKVNGKFSLNETEGAAPAGGYRITGEDIALAPTREDIARMEQGIATAQNAPRNDNGVQDAPDSDAEELGAPTREDIARMDRDKKLKGPLLMKDSLDRELEKLYRLQQLNQIQDNAYFVELFKVNAAYQEAGRDFTEAFNRVLGAYQGDVETQGTVENKNSHISLEDYANSESPVWRNVAYNDDATKTSIMQSTHDAMVAEGSVVSVTQDVIDTVEQSFPDLRSMKKKERTPILKDAINKLKNNIRQFLIGLSNQNFEFEVNGKILDAKLYSTGINEVLEKVTQEKANMLYSTEKIFRNARYLYSTPDYDGDPNVYRWNYFYTPVQIGDETVGVRIAVRDVATPRESQIYNWGIKKDASLGGVGRGTNNRISHGASSDASTNNIPEDVAGVKYSVGESVAEEIGAPTREDIMRMEMERELYGDWRMTDPLDRKVEKLYRLQQLNQIQDNAYFVELFKANAAYQAAGRDFTEAFNRVLGAYQGAITANEKVQDENTGIRNQLRNHQEVLDSMQPVAEIQTSAEYAQMNIAEKKNWIVEKLRSTGYKVERKGFGIIDFAKKRLKSAFNYFDKNSVEEVAFEAIPSVLENGVEIENRNVHKDRNYGTVTIAAPITINGKRGNMAVVVKKTDGNYYKVHRILTPDGSVFNLSEMTNEAESTPAGESPINGSLATPKDSASVISIPENVSDVKQEEVEAVLGEKGTYVSKQANALYDEVKSMQKGKRVSNTLSYLLDTISRLSTTLPSTRWN